MSAALISAAGVVLVALITFLGSRLQAREAHSLLARDVELRDKMPEGAARDELDRLIHLRIRHMRFRKRTDIDNRVSLNMFNLGLGCAAGAIVVDLTTRLHDFAAKTESDLRGVGVSLLITAAVSIVAGLAVKWLFRPAFDSDDPPGVAQDSDSGS